jgi:HAD superfamily hydrolase (TIGR01490 family)
MRAAASATDLRHAMRLALFDLDNTLLEADSDLEWSELLAAEGAMDRELARDFHAQYQAGTLDIDAFLRFQLEPLAREPMERLFRWRERFVRELVRPRLSRIGRDRLRLHREQGHEIALVTATNAFLAEPVAHELGIRHVLATRAEMRDGRFTGRVDGLPCFREGKIVHVDEWLAARWIRADEIEESWFYSDSHNDRPLLERVHHPIAVDADPTLLAHARERGWKRERWAIAR